MSRSQEFNLASLIERRRFSTGIAVAASSLMLQQNLSLATEPEAAFKLKYILGSCMYGYTKLDEIMPQVKKVGASAIDIWPKVHGDQREQITAMGEAKFKGLLSENGVALGCLTQYKLGPFGLKQEMQFASRFGCRTIVTGGKGPKGLKGDDLKKAVKQFVTQMKPHLEAAEESNVVIAIENHGNNLIQSPDSMKWLIEMSGPNMGIALAPYHLPQDEKLLAKLIRDLGNRIQIFYAWQHGMGCMKKLPKEQELLQLPGRGELDFLPLLEALKEIRYSGWTEIFMHPVSRGIPILETTNKVTEEINRSRAYLEKLLANA